MTDEVFVSGKSKDEIAYTLMHDLMRGASDLPKNPTRADYLKNFMAARSAVYGNSDHALGWLKK